MVKERYFIVFYVSSERHYGFTDIVTKGDYYMNIPLAIKQIKEKNNIECDLTLTNIIELSHKDYKIAFETNVENEQ